MSIINAGPNVGDLVRISHGSEMELLDAKWADDGIKMLREKVCELQQEIAELRSFIKNKLPLYELELINAKKTKSAEVYEMSEVNSARVRDVY